MQMPRFSPWRDISIWMPQGRLGSAYPNPTQSLSIPCLLWLSSYLLDCIGIFLLEAPLAGQVQSTGLHRLALYPFLKALSLIKPCFLHRGRFYPWFPLLPLFVTDWSSATFTSYTTSSFLSKTDCKAGALGHSCGFKPSLLSTCLEALGIHWPLWVSASPFKMMGIISDVQAACEDR